MKEHSVEHASDIIVEPVAATRAYAFLHLHGDESSEVRREIAVETPVSIEVNGIGFAVMMATPSDLEDFAVGFALAERLLDDASEIRSLDVATVPLGMIVRLDLHGDRKGRLLERVRTRVTESACGLCGMENLEAFARALPKVREPHRPSLVAVDRALGELDSMQSLGRLTRATHAAALCELDGKVRFVREDVGRHNALDKLIGAAIRNGALRQGRFALMTSRLSFELVEKAVRGGLSGLAAISAPTSLALERAEQSGLPVTPLARGGTLLSDPERI